MHRHHNVFKKRINLNNMKICLIELMPFPYTVGGGTTHLINLSESFCALGHDVHIISSKPAKEYKLVKKISKKIKVHNVGIRHKRFKGNLFYYFYRMLFEFMFVLSALIKIRKIKPDIIDCQSAITTALPASLSGFPFVITCHGIHSEGFEKLYRSKAKMTVAGLFNKIYYFIAKFNSKRALRLISQGKTTLDFYGKLAGNSLKTTVIPNLVDINFWNLSGRRVNKNFVVVARLTKQKSIDKIILAMKDLDKCNLFIIGDGEQESYLKSIAGKNVSFLGYKTPAECKEIYKNMTFTALPSEFEGLPYSILEGMSSGLIPMTTKVGDLQELIKDGKNGFFFLNNSPKTIANTIKRALKSNLNTISNEARKTIINNYSSAEVSKKFVDAYLKAIKVYNKKQ